MYRLDATLLSIYEAHTEAPERHTGSPGLFWVRPLTRELDAQSPSHSPSLVVV